MRNYFLADDLSGALDAAGAFHHVGETVTITWQGGAEPSAGLGGVTAITTETRNLAPAAAAAVVAAWIDRMRALGGQILYKKIDSTLRGPVAAELGALAAGVPEARILFCPANPSVGRTVREGVLHVHGVPVAETEFARDPVSPVRESRIRSLLGDALAERVVIADAESSADLTAAVMRMDAVGTPWVGVGSGALARPIAARLAQAGDGQPRPLPALASGPVLMICGSAHAANRVQARRLWETRGVPTITMRWSEVGTATKAAIAAIRSGPGAAVVIETKRGDSAEVVRGLAVVAEAVVGETGVRRLFVTGGETAFALCARLGIPTLQFQAEIESGLSLSDAASAAGPLRFAIKPGGFGDEATWLRAWDALRR